MKTTALIAIILFTSAVCRAQRPTLPIAPPQGPGLGPGPTPPINQPIVVNGDIIVPAAPTNEPANSMETNHPEMETNELMPTNEAAETNHAAGQMNAHNPELAAAYALTNRLSVMAPAQVQGVLRVQVGVGSLQDLASSLHGHESVLVAIQHNPQLQRGVDRVGDHIINLARGQAKPSRDSVDRLSLDLLRAFSHTHLAQDHDLILAIVINLACNSERLSGAELDNAVNNGVTVLQANGVSQAVCNSFFCDLHSIALELQPEPGSEPQQ